MMREPIQILKNLHLRTIAKAGANRETMQADGEEGSVYEKRSGMNMNEV